jgi:hypothetical protein
MVNNMEITRFIVRRCVFIFGPIVLASYWFGVSKMEDPMALWGGIPESVRPANIFCMFLAAIGFLIMWWLFLYKWDATSVEALNWPWAESNVGGHARLLLAFLLVMIPSALWLELTGFHIANDYSWTPYLVVGNLIVVAIGNILLGLLALNAYHEDFDGAIWCVIGSMLLAIQVIINDAIWWSFKFPW